MHDLNTINKINAEAVQRGAHQAALAGKYVLLKYTGVNFVDFEAHDTHEAREAAAAQYEGQSYTNVSRRIDPPVVQTTVAQPATAA